MLIDWVYIYEELSCIYYNVLVYLFFGFLCNNWTYILLEYISISNKNFHIIYFKFCFNHQIVSYRWIKK